MGEWTPYVGVADVKGPHKEDYPEKVKDGNWYLLGVWDNDRAVYLNWQGRRLHFVTRDENGSLKEEESRELVNDISTYVTAVGSCGDDGWDQWSELAWPFYTAALLPGGTVLSDQERLAFTFRHIYDIPRTDTARMLGKSPNTLDNQYRNAKQKIEQSTKLIDYLSNDLGIIEA